LSSFPNVGVSGAKWVSVDLQKNSVIDTVVLYPRTDGEVDSNGQTPSYPVDFEIQVRAAGTATITVVMDINGFEYTCSQELVVTEKDKTPPADVTNVAVVEGNGQITITWTDPEDSDLDKIKIVDADEASSVQPVYVEPGVETVTITGLTNGKNYTFRITAIDTAGNESAGVLVNATPAESGTFTVVTTFTVGKTSNATKLEAAKVLDASANITNNGTENRQVLMLVALYDSNNRMINVSYLSKLVAGGATVNFNAGFKLPSDVTDCKARVFVWDGKDIESSNMIPLSNAVEITD